LLINRKLFKELYNLYKKRRGELEAIIMTFHKEEYGPETYTIARDTVRAALRTLDPHEQMAMIIHQFYGQQDGRVLRSAEQKVLSYVADELSLNPANLTFKHSTPLMRDAVGELRDAFDPGSTLDDSDVPADMSVGAYEPQVRRSNRLPPSAKKYHLGFQMKSRDHRRGNGRNGTAHTHSGPLKGIKPIDVATYWLAKELAEQSGGLYQPDLTELRQKVHAFMEGGYTSSFQELLLEATKPQVDPVELEEGLAYERQLAEARRGLLPFDAAGTDEGITALEEMAITGKWARRDRARSIRPGGRSRVNLRQARFG